MKLTGFADEAGKDLATQIKATQELGWKYISARGIDGKNIHDLSDSDFEAALSQLETSGIQIAEFGSLIGSWSKSIESDFEITLGEVERCISRMHRLGTKIVRIMSYAQKPWGEDQLEQERFRRLREITKRFTDEGIVTAHENCMNYGGFSSQHTLRLLEEVPGLKLIFDTGNPVFQRDRSQPEPQPWQDAWMFYQAIREHIVHVHIKDCRNPKADGEEPEYVFPGDGQAYVPAILSDLKSSGYDGFIAIEPHVATVFHAKADEIDWDQCYQSYVEYGRQLELLI
ncbi:sugar phosphate isomerase/epimerase [Luteolibacter pohnpeiensis]|uniref:Sugar phosphate isomerase/epimerase n=1 Tax=Luteolibacter pohnpeiensis TaxID=454153 RepID=A0A934VWA8_9BACT|nr:sugar phosphate isomerase/epimerase [Luteolibacter pohnpeiensis]MBK1882623.1 sugar phosphate isomerase/epimerase [Luteolibacter pohnpeiensis]